jgi:N-acetylmuramoyl-L-alanine amidase
MAIVFLNAGHGGKDSGAAANGFKEKDLNLTITLECEKELKRHGVTVVMARSTDKALTSGQIIQLEKSSKADLAVDIHNNAGGGDGVEVFYHYKGGLSKTLAGAILGEVVKIGQNSRGAKTRRNALGQDYYYFIRQTKAPAVIVECAFVDNANDIKIIDTEAEQKAMGRAIAKGILQTLNIAFIEPTVEKPVESVKKSTDEVAKEVMTGKWGNGSERKQKLTEAGYDYAEVQAKVNLLTGTTPAKKTNEEIAKEVMAGKWGNGAERKKRLAEAGYNYAAIQKIVNRLLK